MSGQAAAGRRNIHCPSTSTCPAAAKASDGADGHESGAESATATPVPGRSIREAVHAGELSAGRRSPESAEMAASGSKADLALLVWPVIEVYAAPNPEITGAEKWVYASTGPWSVPEELARRVKVVVGVVVDVLIAAWGVSNFDCRKRILPAGRAEMGCTFELGFESRADALIGRSINPAIRTEIFMYAELDKLLRFGQYGR